MSDQEEPSEILKHINPLYEQLQDIVEDEPTFIAVGAASKLWFAAMNIAISHLLENIQDLDPIEVAQSVVVLNEAKESSALQYAAYYNALVSNGKDQGDEPISSDDLESAKESIDSICKQLFEGGDE